MKINVGKDLNLTGAAILSDKLALNVSGNINKKDLQDSYTSESMSLGASTSINFGGSGTGAGSSNGSGDSGNVGKTNSNPNQPTIIGSGDKPNPAPGGSTTISGSYSQNESSRTTYATIGSLSATLLDDSDPNKLRLTSSTNSMIGADFEGGLTIDHRLFSEGGRQNIGKDFTNLGPNLKTMRQEADKSPFKIGAILNAPNTLLEGAIYTFTEKKNDPEGSQLITLKIEDGKLTQATNRFQQNI